MVRRTKTDDLAASLAQIAALGTDLGISVDVHSILNNEQIVENRKRSEQKFELGLHTILLSEHFRHATTMVLCQWCEEKFLTTYCYQMFCSTECMKAEFEQHFGVAWDILKRPPTQWEYEPVACATPAMTKALYDYAKYLVQMFENLPAQEYESLPEDFAEKEGKVFVDQGHLLPPLTQKEPALESSSPEEASLPQEPDTQWSVSFDF